MIVACDGLCKCYSPQLSQVAIQQKKNIIIMTKKRRKILRLYIFSLRLSALAWGRTVCGCQLKAKG